MAGALALALVGCGKGEPSQKGDPGPAGPKGDAGPRGPAGAGMRILRANCDATACAVQCADDEVLVTAYCGAAHNPPLFPTERSASCRTRTANNSPIVAACAKPAP